MAQRPSGLRIEAGAGALFRQRSASGNLTWLRSEGLSASYGARSRGLEYWMELGKDAAYGPLGTGIVGDGHLAERLARAGFERRVGRGFLIGAQARIGELKGDESSASFIPVAYDPKKPATLSLAAQLARQEVWAGYLKGDLDVKAVATLNARDVVGELPSADLSYRTSIPVATLPNTLGAQVSKGAYHAEFWSGKRHSNRAFAGSSGTTELNGKTEGFLVSKLIGARSWSVSGGSYSGDSDGVLGDAGLLGLGLPHASFATYKASLRARAFQVRYSSPLRFKGGGTTLDISHFWVSADAVGDYALNALFVNFSGSGSTRIAPTRGIAARVTWRKSPTSPTYVVVQQALPYSGGSGVSTSGAGSSGRASKPYGGLTVAIGWSHPTR